MSEAWKHTDEQKQSLGGASVSVDAMRAHATNYRADEVNVEDGINVDDMEQDRDAQEAEAPKACHLVCVVASCMTIPGKMLCRSRSLELLMRAAPATLLVLFGA
jgi:hypothetical protein